MFEVKLIEKVRVNPMLYDLKNKNYRKTALKEKLWKVIATELHTTSETCKTKWKSLRDSYRRVSTSYGKGDDEPKKKWKYFERMMFLGSAEHIKPTVVNYPMDLEMNNENNTNIVDILKNFNDENSLASTQDFDVESNDNFASSSTPEQTYMNINETTQGFEFFLNNATEAISRISGTIAKPETSTAMLLSALALKIENANLPNEIVDELEMEVTAIVYNKLAQMRKKD